MLRISFNDIQKETQSKRLWVFLVYTTGFSLRCIYHMMQNTAVMSEAKNIIAGMLLFTFLDSNIAIEIHITTIAATAVTLAFFMIFVLVKKKKER